MFRDICEEFRATGRKNKLEEYYNKYIFSCETFDDSLSKMPYKQLSKVKELDGGQPIIL